MLKIYVVNGAPESGKTHFERYIQQHTEIPCFIYSTIDFVKDLAKLAGWDGTKTPKNRAFLSNLKDLLTEWNDIPFMKTKEYIQNIQQLKPNQDLIFFIDVREPREIEKMKQQLGAKTVCIRRFSAEQAIPSNHADSNVLEYEYDHYIFNNSTLENYNINIEFFMKQEDIK